MVHPRAGKTAVRSGIEGNGRAKISARAGLAIYIPPIRAGFEPRRVVWLHPTSRPRKPFAAIPPVCSGKDIIPPATAAPDRRAKRGVPGRLPPDNR